MKSLNETVLNTYIYNTKEYFDRKEADKRLLKYFQDGCGIYSTITTDKLEILRNGEVASQQGG